MMTIEEMTNRGAEHRKAGKKCVPFDCREVDAEIFAAANGCANRRKFYSEMRGAFNSGWQAEHFKATSL